MENKMYIRFICGINGDRVEVKVTNLEGEVILNKELVYGANVSSSRKNARYSLEDYENSIKYNWTYPYVYKPFIGDVLFDIVETYFINRENIEYSGYFVLLGEEMRKEEVEQIVLNIIKEM